MGIKSKFELCDVFVSQKLWRPCIGKIVGIVTDDYWFAFTRREGWFQSWYEIYPTYDNELLYILEVKLNDRVGYFIYPELDLIREEDI